MRPDIRDGVYTVINAVGNELLGSSVRVGVRGQNQSAFLLTAGHSVHEEYLSKRSVRLVDRFGHDRGVARVAFSQFGQGGYDIALLQSESLHGPSLALIEPGPDVEGLVRGSPAGLSAEQTSMRCWISGDEQVGDLRLLDVTVTDLQLVDVSGVAPGDEPMHAVLVGLSGGPVIVGGAVAGVLSIRDRSPIANHVLASPSTEIARCLGAVGFELEWQTADAAPDTGSSSSEIGKAYIVEALQSQERELELWELLSHLFYGGVRTDLDLASGVDLMVERGGALELPVLRGRFLLGRFALKRGDVPTARSLLTEVSRALRSRRDPDSQTLRTLAEIRLLVEATPVDGDPIQRARNLYGLIQALEDCAASDRQKAYEISSAAGREALTLSMAFGRDLDGVIKSEFFRLQAMHNRILHEWSDELYDKQGMVEFILDAIACLWRLDGTSSNEMSDRLIEIVESGRRGARDRRNVNFHFPMLMARAVADKWRGQVVEAYTGTIVAGQALRRAGLALDHEGVCHVLAFMAHNEPELAAMLHLAYRAPTWLPLQQLEADPLRDRVSALALTDAVARSVNANDLTAQQMSWLNIADL